MASVQPATPRDPGIGGPQGPGIGGPQGPAGRPDRPNQPSPAGRTDRPNQSSPAAWSSDVDAWGRSERARDFFRLVYGPVYRHWFRAEWDGLDKIPTSGGALLVANHGGALPADALVIMHGIEEALGRPVYALSDRWFETVPGLATVWARLGGVTATPGNAHRLLHDEQQLVLVFPEGTKGTAKPYRERYRLQRFGRGGFIETAMRAGVPVVPIAVVGSEEAMPTLALLPWLDRVLGVPYVPLTANVLTLGPLGLVTHFPAKFRLRALDPMHFDAQPGQAAYPRAAVQRAASAVQRDIQAALDALLATRRNPWTG